MSNIHKRMHTIGKSASALPAYYLSKNQASTFLSVSCPDADGTLERGVREPSGRMYSEASTPGGSSPYGRTTVARASGL